MIIIENENIDIDNFHKRLEKTKNNIYLCENKKLIKEIESKNSIDNINNIDSIVNINTNKYNNYCSNIYGNLYNLNEIIIKNRKEKINRILQKIEDMNINNYNENYYTKYNKNNKKKNKLIKEEYKLSVIKFQKIYNSSFLKVNRIANKRLLNYKKLI
jgi:hypothetical protein